MNNLTLYYRLCDVIKQSAKQSFEEYADDKMFKLTIAIYIEDRMPPIKEYIIANGWGPYTMEQKKDLKKLEYRHGDKISLDIPSYIGEDNREYDTLREYSSRYFNVIYNRERDKIVINYTTKGYGWNIRRQSYFPLKRTDPVLTKTDKFWYFRKVKTNLSVRELKLSHPLPESVRKALIKVFNLTDMQDECDMDFFERDYSYDASFDILFRRVLETRNISKAVEAMFKTTLPKAVKNSVQLPDIATFARIIHPDDYNKMCQTISVLNKKGNTQISMWGLLTEYFKSTFKEGRINDYIIRDFMKEHVMLNRKMNLKIKSYKRLILDHEELSTLIRNRCQSEIKVKKKFLKCFDKFQGDYELIMTRERLNKEGAQMKHCVAGYGPRINSGECCIVSILWTDGHRYTAQINHDSINKSFYLVQLQGYRNSIHGQPPVELYLKIQNECGITIPKSEISAVAEPIELI